MASDTVKLIVNADDFGLTEQVTEGILRSHSEGIVRSTSAMFNMKIIGKACKNLKYFPQLRVGIHVVITEGYPISDPAYVKDLIAENGMFNNSLEQMRRLMWPRKKILQQVKIEICQQVKTAIDLGIELTHIDSHHGVHRFPVVAAAIRDLASDLSVPMKIRNQKGGYWCEKKAPADLRIKKLFKNIKIAHKLLSYKYNNLKYQKIGFIMPDIIIKPNFYLGNKTDILSILNERISSMKGRSGEFVVHPGLFDPKLPPKDAEKRVQELNMLCSSKMRSIMDKNNVQLISYDQL